MATNFDFLKNGWPGLLADARETERNTFAAPRTCVFYARRTLELAVRWMYKNDAELKPPYTDSLAALLHEQTFKDNLPSGLFNQIIFIQKIGNSAVHSDKPVNQYTGLQAAKSLHAFMKWLVTIYSETPPAVAPYDDSLIPKSSSVAAADKSAADLVKLQESLASKDAAIAEAETKLAGSLAEIEELKAHIAKIKAANEAKIHSEDFTEEETRKHIIDLLLAEAGWDVDAPSVREFPVKGMPYGTGEGFVDYVLWDDSGLPLAVVEAKRTTKDPTAGKQQAKLYADCLEKMTGRRPVIYYTNGYETHLWDDCTYPPRHVQGFHTKDELLLMVHRRTTRKDIRHEAVSRDIVNRYYQEEAVRRVMETYQSKGRKALAVMATGTGKTRMAVAAVDLLMKANWVRRVLFLADRNALVRQAKNAFSKFLPNASVVNLCEGKEDDKSRIVFSTYPTMMNCIDEVKSGGNKRFGVGHFDLIIIDEAHRSVYQKFGAIFEYFDAMLLGLTATPKSEVDKNTYRLFELENNVPTYSYELSQAVADEYLVPPKAISVPLKFQREGVKYSELSEEDKEQYEEVFGDPETGEAPEEIGSEALNRWLFNEDTVDKVLAHLMLNGLKVEGGDRLGKTLIFAKNHNHAEFIVKRFDENYPHLKGHFCRVIDNKVNCAQSLIDDFYGPAKNPIIAVSVDMMDTGIDVPEIVNIVFFKLVRSKVKFWQMIGRGTRLCPDLFGPRQNKEFFYIFDYCQNLEFFSENPDGVEARAQESVKQKVFKRRLAIAALLTESAEEDFTLKALRGELLDQMHACVRTMDVNNFIVRPHRRYVDEFANRERWESLSVGDTANIIEHLTPLPTADEDDEFARRFDLVVLNMQLAIFESNPQQIAYQERIRELASALEEKKAVPSVAAQLELIQEIQTDTYWEGVTLPMLEKARKSLRNLIKFIDKGEALDHVYTDFQDEMGEAVEIDGLILKDASLKNYRLKVEAYIREHQDHITIHRLRTNKPISGADLKALEDILFSGDGMGTKDDFIAAYGTERPLGLFVRSIVGLDRNAAKESFAEFLEKRPLSGNQITFVNQIIDHLAANGVMEPKLLFEPPFTDIHHDGVVGVFPDGAERVVSILKRVNENALAV